MQAWRSGVQIYRCSQGSLGSCPTSYRSRISQNHYSKDIHEMQSAFSTTSESTTRLFRSGLERRLYSWSLRTQLADIKNKRHKQVSGRSTGTAVSLKIKVLGQYLYYWTEYQKSVLSFSSQTSYLCITTRKSEFRKAHRQILSFEQLTLKFLQNLEIRLDNLWP